MNTPMVSVIVPVYKAETTIEQCVCSILENHVNLELILVDDGSPDLSGAICDQLAANDPRIRVLHKKNGGVGSARNAGIELAVGKYIAFVDADDTVSANMYWTMMSKAEGSGADCVVCNIVMQYATHEKPESHVFGEQIIVGQEHVNSIILIPLTTPGHMNSALLQGPCNKLYRREIIQQHDLRFSHLPYAEDWLFNIEFFMHTDAVAFVDESLYFYDRTAEASLSKSWRKDSFQNTVWIQNRLAQLFPRRYRQEELQRGVLGIQEECLRNYAYYCGIRGFSTYASGLFSAPELIDAYQALTELPPRYRFAKMCIRRGWRKRYCLWALNAAKMTLIKFYIRKMIT